MPQFDIFAFSTQIFWVFFSFCILYLLFCFVLLPALATVMKVRKIKISRSIEKTSNETELSQNFNKNIAAETVNFINIWNDKKALEISNKQKYLVLLNYLVLPFEKIKNYDIQVKQSINCANICKVFFK